MMRKSSPALRVGFSLLIAVAFFVILAVAVPSPPKVVQQDAFSVAGIEVRTSNAKEAASGVIGKQWQKFFQDGVLQKISTKIGDNIYAVYSDYAGDHYGEYSFLIGAKVPNGSPVPAGLVLKTVPAGRYAVLTTGKGQVAKVVIAAWQQVWTMEEKHQLGGPRAYKSDFELYDQRSEDPQNSQVDLYIGLK
jgi:predicted transcriptional regulator YdeE